MEQDIQVTWKIAAQVWWSIIWRVMALNAVFGIFLRFLPSLGSASENFAIRGALGSIAIVMFTIYAVKTVLTLKWDSFSLKVQAND